MFITYHLFCCPHQIQAIDPECNTREIETCFPLSVCSSKNVVCKKKIQHHLRMAADLNRICQRFLFSFSFFLSENQIAEIQVMKLIRKTCIFQFGIKINHEILCDKTVLQFKKTISFILFQFFFFSAGYLLFCQTNVRYVQLQYFVVQWGGMSSVVSVEEQMDNYN